MRVRTLFKNEYVDFVINADETSVLFHMQDGHLILPTGIKRVGTAAQVDNEKVGATVIIGFEFRTSTILRPLIIFTGVYGAKLMKQWESFEDGNAICLDFCFYFYSTYIFCLLMLLAKVIFNESHWMTSHCNNLLETPHDIVPRENWAHLG
jgi:hypothetical protein